MLTCSSILSSIFLRWKETRIKCISQYHRMSESKLINRKSQVSQCCFVAPPLSLKRLRWGSLEISKAWIAGLSGFVTALDAKSHALGRLGMQSRLPEKRTGPKPRTGEHVACACGKLQLRQNKSWNIKKDLSPKFADQHQASNNPSKIHWTCPKKI